MFGIIPRIPVPPCLDKVENVESMKIARKLGCALLLLNAMALSAADSDGQESKLVVLEHLWNEAQVHRDSRALEGMIGEQFINTEYDGEVSDRAKFLADIEDPKFKPAEFNIKDVKVNMYHTTAIVTGSYRVKGSYNSQPYEHVGRFTDTWVLDNGKWLCVASHASLVKKN